MKLPKIKRSTIFLLFGTITWTLAIFGNYLEGRSFTLFPPFLLPFVFLPALGFLLFSIIAVVSFFCDFRNRRRQIAASLTVGLWVAPFLFTPPEFEHGMADKLRESVSEQLILEFAAEIRRQHKELDPELEHARQPEDWEWPQEFQTLGDLFASKPDIGVGPGAVYFEWGSSLVGHWGIIVFDKSLPKAPALGPYSYNPGLFAFKNVWVYRGM